MKKLLLMLFLLTTVFVSAQQFTTNYTYCIKVDSLGNKGEWKYLPAKFIYYVDNKNIIQITFGESVLKLEQITDVEKGTTPSGDNYEMIKARDTENDKETVYIQLFSDVKYGVRLLLENGDSYQFVQD